jgi:hypothetical protein
MNHVEFDRRASLAGLPMSAFAAALFGASEAASAADAAALGLDDPVRRARVRAKMMASAGSETVYTFYRVHTFAYLHAGNLQPLFTTHVLNARVCRPKSETAYAFTTYEGGVVTTFDSDAVLDTWDNPFTGETVKVWPLINGPLSVEAGPDCIGTAAALMLKPRGMRIDVMGDLVFMPTVSAVTTPNAFQPDVWPKESTGPEFHWDSHFTYISPLASVIDTAADRAPAVFYLQNLGSWYPWMRIAGHTGRMYGRSFGRKLTGFDDIPAPARKNLEARIPEIFDLARWTTPRDRDDDYMKANRPA